MPGSEQRFVEIKRQHLFKKEVKEVVNQNFIFMQVIHS
jgi:hypothetical protein